MRRFIKEVKRSDDKILKTGSCILLMVSAITISFIVGERYGFEKGKSTALHKVKYTIDKSIMTGEWFSFDDNDILLVKLERRPKMHKDARRQADADFGRLVKYRAMQVYKEDEGFTKFEF